MTVHSTPVSRTARWRARAAACVRSERGDTLIEVVVAALLVALIATAVLGGFSSVARISESQRNEQQAAALAQQDQARLRSLTIGELASSGTDTGNWQQPAVLIDGTDYQVTSTSQFVSATTGQYTCSSSGGGGATADEIATTSTVDWGPNYNNNGRTPVIVHGLITPTAGGALVASATNQSGAGLSGVTVSISGPTSVSPLTTTSSGCVVFAGLGAGSYTVTYTPPTGNTWVLAPSSAALTQTVTVTTAQTADTSVQLGEASQVQASFTTTYNSATVPATADLFTVENGQVTPTMQTFGTRSTRTQNNYSATLTSSAVFYPFPSSEPNSYLYGAWAGYDCTGDEPPSQDQPAGFSLTPGGTTDVTIQEPALIVLPYTGNATQTPSYTNYTADQTVFSFTPSNDWSLTSHSGDYPTTGTDAGKDEESNNTSAYATWTLPADTTSVTVLGTYTSTSGYATISLNGTTVGTQDLYHSTTETGQPVYQNSSLSPTTSYTLKIAPSGTAGAGGGKYISIDEVEYTTVSYTTTYSQGPLMTTAPDVTITDTGTGCGNAEDYPPTQVPTATQGALASPGLPYGTYTVCVDNGTNHVTLTGVQNTNYTTGTQVVADIYPGGTGYATGTCT